MRENNFLRLLYLKQLEIEVDGLTFSFVFIKLGDYGEPKAGVSRFLS